MLLVDFINVGYGDAILLRETETPFAMLVDCGDARIGRSRPDGRRITAADYLRREGIRELDLLVLTHLHLDHAGGLTHLLPGVRVREFWTNYLPPEEMWGHTLPRAAAGTWRRLTALSTTPVSACGYPMPGRRLSCRGMCMPPAGSGTSSRPAPS